MSVDTRVPLLIRAPHVRPRRVGSPVELLDVFPTIVRLAGVKPPAKQARLREIARDRERSREIVQALAHAHSA